MDRYIGLEVHATSCTIAVVGPSGRKLQSHVVETSGQALVEQVRAIARPRHLCLEEGTQSAWLYELLSPHVDELVVAGVAPRRGPKSDALDAMGLAQRPGWHIRGKLRLDLDVVHSQLHQRLSLHEHIPFSNRANGECCGRCRTVRVGR